MNKIRKHIDKVFSKYPKTNETLDLKEEVIGNLEAEIEDLQNSGVSFEEAFHVSIEKMPDFAEVIEGSKSVDKNKLVFGMLQWMLIYLLVTWIITMPLSIIGNFRNVSFLLFFAIIIVSGIYGLLVITRDLIVKGITHIDLFKVAKVKKTVWIIWGLFLLIAWGGITGLHFASNIWYSNPITISGPYQFANIFALYALPLITIIVPLLSNRLEKTITQYEEGEKI
ncbi:permease prefix domain 1-containing protein [Sporosarcina siberiensis]|uniref:Permease prefix domain 1-containing protein n=1 Tax=Sporosarcina siberiensis TaxID=1365606 RepID=A0ABW4SF55_9BACL